MPTVINGTGTWYYGKRRIHTLKAQCEFCNRQVDLTSYDTTLFFVIFFIPIIPLQQKRILGQCSACQRHRVIGLKKWEESKSKASADLLEKLSRDPDNPEAIQQAIRFSIGYQDEPLFNKVVDSLASGQTTNASVQETLGDAYGFFARWPEAAQAYLAALAVVDKEEVREQLALALLKQGRPDDAKPFLKHVIEQKKAESAGMVYLLAEGFQAQGRHEEALAIMDERDQAFPQWADGKAYKQQRKTSMRLRNTEKRVKSTFLSDGKSGYRDGGWFANWPRVIAASIFLGLLALYFGSALYIGQARKVFLVNGTNSAYKVSIQGQKLTLPPNSPTLIRLTEGDWKLDFADPKIEPLTGTIETEFFTRPFTGHTFLINPDRYAVIVEAEAYYAAANPRQPNPPTIHFGETSYSLPGVDYEFQGFPQTIQVEGSSQVRKTRVGLENGLSAEARLNMMDASDQASRIAFCESVLRLDPSQGMLLYWLTQSIAPEEIIAFVESKLEDKPILVEWHRIYQEMMERTHAETDLLPRYQKLLADNNGKPEAIYLLGRANPKRDETEKYYREAAAFDPPSPHAISALAFLALVDGRFAEASRLFEKATPLHSEKALTREYYYASLLANQAYDALLQALQRDAQSPGEKLPSLVKMTRVYAIRGQKDRATQTMNEVIQLAGPEDRALAKKILESLVCQANGDTKGYLKAVEDAPTFEAAFLQRQFDKAAEMVGEQNNATAQLGLLYLQAARSAEVGPNLPEKRQASLLEALAKGNRDEKLVGDFLTGKKPLNVREAQRLAIAPDNKRILLLVLAQRFPDQAKQLVPLATRLNYQHDAISLCLSKLPEAKK